LQNHFPDAPLKFGKRRSECGSPGIEYNIPTWVQFGAVQPEGFAQAALDPVPDHAPADCARYREPEPGT